jgi:hypothetical protein
MAAAIGRPARPILPHRHAGAVAAHDGAHFPGGQFFVTQSGQLRMAFDTCEGWRIIKFLA